MCFGISNHRSIHYEMHECFQHTRSVGYFVSLHAFSEDRLIKCIACVAARLFMVVYFVGLDFRQNYILHFICVIRWCYELPISTNVKKIKLLGYIITLSGTNRRRSRLSVFTFVPLYLIVVRTIFPCSSFSNHRMRSINGALPSTCAPPIYSESKQAVHSTNGQARIASHHARSLWANLRQIYDQLLPISFGQMTQNRNRKSTANGCCYSWAELLFLE